ncbi:hypothetical protein BC629DRAFT_1458978 [Irpex lacteus]|nr:hypothetical protein BC629DRAFT_1458978 [Irpex lacteus]
MMIVQVKVALRLARRTPIQLHLVPYKFAPRHTSYASNEHRKSSGTRDAATSKAQPISPLRSPGHTSYSDYEVFEERPISIRSTDTQDTVYDIPLDELPEIPGSPQSIDAAASRCSGTVISFGSDGALWRDAVNHLEDHSVVELPESNFAAVAQHLPVPLPYHVLADRKPSTSSVESDATLCGTIDHQALLKKVGRVGVPKFGVVRAMPHPSHGSIGQAWEKEHTLIASSDLDNNIDDVASDDADTDEQSSDAEEVARSRSHKGGRRSGEGYKRLAAYDAVKVPREAKRQGDVWEDFIRPGWETDYGPPFYF